MIVILWNFISFIIALGILIFVHELGHFLVARFFGVKVEKFSIGLGKSIWKKVDKHGTEYCFSMIPIGGYIQMLDTRVNKLGKEEQCFAFDKQKIWKRIAIVIAGPISNFLFAIFIYFFVFLIGISAIKPIIGNVKPNSIADYGGLKVGMELTSISNIQTPDWNAVNIALMSNIGNKHLTLTVKSESNKYFFHDEMKVLDLALWNFKPNEETVLESLGVVPYFPDILLTLSHVLEGTAADRAGFQSGDSIVSVNGILIKKWDQVVNLIRSNPNRFLMFVIDRNGEKLELPLIPDSKKNRFGEIVGVAGLVPETDKWPENYQFKLQYSIFESIGKAIEKTKNLIKLTVSLLIKLLVQDLGLDQLSGPITIAKSAGTTASYGFVYFLSFLGLISINLGVINLVPLPMLDGGHLFFLIIEAIIRRPISKKVQEIGYIIGGVIIFFLMSIALLNDFSRL
ncbi:sigma E protease regulator RseP [Candidatus Photodesmus anomalopis]|uniref:Zinc metalloprotease n=1 Tax=Candidatus Photodesmus katoptron Akat1 TaxID=1236703 RepID=S3EIB1_9GAMM|nr:sigma E protease regulator RseP [Candidatus Photodesmus katoptron]EPE37923.1 peptidase M50 [Candidatus Photodesmus katoptron Akat1]